MNTKEVKCSKCGKPEMVSVEQAAKGTSFEKAEPELLKGGCVVVHLCDGCVKAIEAFRKTLKN